MKKLLIFISIVLVSCGEPPLQFSADALNEVALDISGNEISLKQILDTHKENTILIDVWASWCGDCIQGFPKVKDLQSQFPEVEFVFLSVDKGEQRWRKSINKYDLSGHHYYLPKGQKGAFGDFLNSNWIPRYMVVDEKGNIKLFKAKKATDERLTEALK